MHFAWIYVNLDILIRIETVSATMAIGTWTAAKYALAD